MSTKTEETFAALPTQQQEGDSMKTKLNEHEGARMSLEGALVDAEQYRAHSDRVAGVVCEKCHHMASEAGQLADTSAPCHPAFDGETCEQCGGFLYYPCYCDVIEP